MGSLWSQGDDWNDESWDDSETDRSPIALLYTVISGQPGLEDEGSYYSDGVWCDKCGDNAGLEADLYCVDCEAGAAKRFLQ